MLTKVLTILVETRAVIPVATKVATLVAIKEAIRVGILVGKAEVILEVQVVLVVLEVQVVVTHIRLSYSR